MATKLLAGMLVLAEVPGTAIAAPVAEVAKPNVLIVYADDIGRGDLSCWGQKNFSTPNIDKLATQGMQFDRFYGASVCAPARASLLTGTTEAHSPIPNKGGLECQLAAGLISQQEFDKGVRKERLKHPSRYFMGQMAKSAGYQTAYFGKLGIGYTETSEFLKSYGFDTQVGLYDSVICWGYYPEYYWENGQKVPLPSNPKFTQATPVCPLVGSDAMVYSEDVWLKKCKAYLGEQSKKKEPFLAIYATQLPHGPVSISPKDHVFKDRTEWTEKERVYASMMHKLDQSIGELLAELDALGLAENTVVIFSGDNGHEPGSYSNHDPSGMLNGFWDGHSRGEDRFNGTLAQRGVKRDNFEGGLNVPFIIRWPGYIKTSSVSQRRTAVYDILPTLAEIMDVKIPMAIDGLSFLPTLTGKGVQKDRNYLFWVNTTGASKEAIIVGDWKLIHEIDREKSAAAAKRRIYRSALYNLKEDPMEKTDRSAEHPEKVQEFEKLIVEALKALP
jgi:arylsulfatase A-like enzyme